MTAKLGFHEVSFGYGVQSIVVDLSFEIERGTMVALLGANGAGKTTVLNLGSGTLPPRSGEIYFNGTDLALMSPRQRARGIAVVPQALSIPFAFSVREVVALGRTPFLGRFGRTGSADSEAIDRALDRTDTDVYADRSVLDLSAGERQRVILAMALAQEPDLLLLDEPTANLDVAHQLSFLRLVRDLSLQQGLTVVAAIHDLNLAALCFDRIIAIHHGQLVADGTPREVLTAATIGTIYGTPVHVVNHPSAPVPLVALIWPTDSASR